MTNENFRYYPTYLNEWEQILSVATPEQVYQLVRMCIDYAKGIDVQKPEEPVMKLCFSLASGSIDRGVEKVNKKSRSARYSRYCGTCSSKGIKPLSFTDWANQIDSKNKNDERQRTSTDDNNGQHSTTKSTDVTNADGGDNINHNINLNPYNHNLNSLNQSIKAPEAPSILMKEPVPEDYRPQYWEDSILKIFWGKFQTEDDYYAYTEKYRDEIIKILDEMEKQGK